MQSEHRRDNNQTMSLNGHDATARSPLPLGIGAAMVAPVGLFGTAMIADYPGPNSVTEFFGWWALCLIVAPASAAFMRRFREKGSLRIAFFALSIAMPLGLGAMLYADIHPDTPLNVKAAVERSLQIVGVSALGALAAFIGWIVWNSRRWGR